MTAFRLTLEYDGGAYAGWQRQPSCATVEGALRAAIASVDGVEPERMTAAGRTDAGTHSHGQVVGVSLQREWAAERLVAALNATLPGDIAVVSAEPVDQAFNARYDAVARTYRYVVVPRRTRAPLTRTQAWYVSGDLDLEAMRRAASLFTGTHDFASFGRTTNPRGTTTRTVNSVTVRRRRLHRAAEQAPLDAVLIDVSANAFLRGMMRAIAGALVAVGQGRLNDNDIRDMLAMPHTSHRHVTVAPAHGLHQWTVTYA